MDLSGIVESLQRGLTEIPPIAYALMLLGGPTAALIGYRLIVVARRATTSSGAEAAPFWVCQSCRSVNELRLSRCYRCAVGRDSTDEIEVILDQPSGRPIIAQVPAGSPFAVLAVSPDGGSDVSSGVPVIAEPTSAPDRVPVGPGRAVKPSAAPPNVLTVSITSPAAVGDLVPAAGSRRRRPARE